MFTGIVKGMGRIAALTEVGGDRRIEIDRAGVELGHLAIGDSVAINGVCLTVVELTGDVFAADVSRETLAHTTLGGVDRSSRVNLEPALRVGDSLSGHWVSGHVDGLAQLDHVAPEARSTRMRFSAPTALARYIARKGSVTLDGVSLTVNAVEDAQFEVNIVPHTLAVTCLGERGVGDTVNLEVDMLARYMERLLQEREES